MKKENHNARPGRDDLELRAIDGTEWSSGRILELQEELVYRVNRLEKYLGI